jgi:hypothetical protein
MSDPLPLKESIPSPESRSVLSRSLGLAKDGVMLAKPAVSAGFSIAQTCVDVGFYIPKRLCLIKHPVNLAHSITTSSLQFSSMIAQTSLHASDRVLVMAGAQDGETYRLLKEYVDSQAHADGHDTRQALLDVAALLVQVGQELSNVHPMELIKGAQQLAEIHHEARDTRINQRKQEQQHSTNDDDWSTSLYMQYAAAIYGTQAALLGCCGGGSMDKEIIIPHPSELTSLSRHMKFAAAAYGAKSCKFMKCHDSLQYWTSDVDAIVSLTGILPGDVLYMSQDSFTSTLYRPAHYCAIDHANQEVIVSIRGTLSMQDVLVDLVCHSEAFQSVHNDHSTLIQGRAHGGFLKSAQTLANDLHELVATTLQQYPKYQLVICGHSLGGGVATVLALLWARIPLFLSRSVRAISFASPCVVCKDISQAPFTRRHVTSVVTGDDVVSRFGLATFRELQSKLLALAKSDDGGDENMEVTPTNDDEKLYCAGRVWWLESKEYEPHPIVEVDPVQELYEIGLFPDMFAIHLPKAYLDTLEALDHHHEQRQRQDSS